MHPKHHIATLDEFVRRVEAGEPQDDRDLMIAREALQGVRYATLGPTSRRVTRVCDAIREAAGRLLSTDLEALDEPGEPSEAAVIALTVVHQTLRDLATLRSELERAVSNELVQ